MENKEGKRTHIKNWKGKEVAQQDIRLFHKQKNKFKIKNILIGCVYGVLAMAALRLLYVIIFS